MRRPQGYHRARSNPRAVEAGEDRASRDAPAHPEPQERPDMNPPAILSLALALSLLLVGPISATRADSFRVKTDRGTYLVEVDAPDVTVRGDGDDLVVSRSQGDEV